MVDTKHYQYWRRPGTSLYNIELVRHRVLDNVAAGGHFHFVRSHLVGQVSIAPPRWHCPNRCLFDMHYDLYPIGDGRFVAVTILYTYVECVCVFVI